MNLVTIKRIAVLTNRNHLNQFDAAEYGNLQWFKDQKAAGNLPKLSHINLLGRAVLSAAENGHLEVVKWLVLESGQPVNVTTHNNYALSSATANGHLEVVGFLNAVIGLHKAGVPIQQIQAVPAMVSLVESGILDPKIAKELSTEDLKNLETVGRSRKQLKL